MFHSVGNRCFVDFRQFNLPIHTAEAIVLLQHQEFELLNVNLADEARPYIGKAEFKLGASVSQAPHIVDCSSFTKWLYGLKGIWIPRFAVQQYEYGTLVEEDSLQSDDLVFTSGYCSKAWHVGHVGLFTGSSVITAMIQSRKSGVIELPLQTFLEQRKLRGMRRMAVSSDDTATILIPNRYEIETSDDIKHLILSLISKIS